MRVRTLAVVGVLCVTGLPAQTADRGVLNGHTPSWLTLNAAARLRAEDYAGVNFEDGNNRGFLLQRYRFSTGIRLNAWMSVFGEMQDAREAGAKNPNSGLKDSLDLRQAYLKLGTEKGFWNVTAGRQMLAYGSERAIGAGEWGNTARVFDAIKLGLHRGVDRVDFFASSIVRNDVDHWDHHRDGDNLHGMYGSIRSAVPKSSLEPYVLYRVSPSFSAAGASGHYNSWTYGFRAASAATRKWGYEADILTQRGDIGASRLRGWGLTLIGKRKFTSVQWKPEASLEYDFASGDRNPTDGVVNTLDQIYPTNHGKYGVVDQIGRRNMKDAAVGVTVHPFDRLAIKTEGHSFWLANRYDALYNAGGGISIPAVLGGASSKDIGRELDVQGDFKLSKHYGIGLQIGRLFPGASHQGVFAGLGQDLHMVFLDLHI
ncbi:MAG: alginate export family protein [Bryobacterales bacterium]